MKKIFLSAFILAPTIMMGQSAIDAFRFTQSDIRGTARFMSMGGAFGALGGDLSTISQNPGGIGVYRSQDIALTFDLDCQSANSSTPAGPSTTVNQTKFMLNNAGGIFSFNTKSYLFPNFNLGLTYNKNQSFNRSYGGVIPNLRNSLSNYVAGVTNANMVTDVDLGETKYPYESNMPWFSILGYDGYLIYPTGNDDMPDWVGQWTDGTSGQGTYSVETKGSHDEYNIAFGGNIADVVFWGMDFGISSLSYTENTYWGEDLDNALIDERFLGGDPNNSNLSTGTANWHLTNWYHASGTGFNYKLGLIFKPIQELRIGVAMHTPTWYSIKETFGAALSTRYGNENQYSTEYTNNGVDGYNEYNFRTPWHFIVSAAGVIGGRFIISADYEWTTYQNMKFSEYNDGWNYYDDPFDWDYGFYDAPTRSSYNVNNDPYRYTNQDIKEYYQTMSTIRLGAEFRVTPQFSVRAGYAYSTTPVREKASSNQTEIYTSGTMPNYTFNNATNYISCGIGYRYQKFYADLAYQYKHTSADYHAYTPSPGSGIPSPQSKLSFNNNNIVMTLGFRF